MKTWRFVVKKEASKFNLRPHYSKARLICIKSIRRTSETERCNGGFWIFSKIFLASSYNALLIINALSSMVKLVSPLLLGELLLTITVNRKVVPLTFL
jgi:hypothetical protein